MTNEMPKKGKLSLEMMYQTCGTQINFDYSSEQDFTKKFKIISFLTPLTTPYSQTLQLNKVIQLVICLIGQRFGRIPREQVYLIFLDETLKNTQISL